MLARFAFAAFVPLLFWYRASPTAPSACTDGAPPLTGTWWTGPNPGGGGMYLALCQAGPSVTGSTWTTGIGPVSALLDSGTVRGDVASRVFVLLIDYGHGKQATYAGQVTDSTLEGVWTQPPDTGRTLTLIR